MSNNINSKYFYYSIYSIYFTKKIFYIFLFTFFSSSIFSQTGWFQQNSLTNQKLSSVQFLDFSWGFACGTNRILRTTDGGSNWNIIFNSDSTQNYFLSLFFINSQSGYICGYGPYGGIILKTINSGLNWISQTTNSTYWINSIYFLPQTGGFYGFAAGDNGKILKTTNGGLNWNIQSPPVLNEYYCIFFIDSSNGYVAGNFSTILKTTNSGINWFNTNFHTISNSIIYSILFFNNSTGYISTASFASPSPQGVYKTTNGGVNWINTNGGGGYGMSFFNENTGFSVGGFGQIFKTTNGGVNWSTQLSGTTNILQSVYFQNQNTGWIVGESGIILKTTTGGEPIGIKPISGNIPTEFKLYQNYPNPFNPGTNIKFQVASTRLVRLVIFDAIGKIVDELVNTELQPGTYELDWNASKFSSGVYFYRIIATAVAGSSTGDYIDTKRMVLLK